MCEVANNLIQESGVTGFVIETEDTSTLHIFRLKVAGVMALDANCPWFNKTSAETENTQAVRTFLAGYTHGWNNAMKASKAGVK